MDFPTLLIRDATKKNGFYKRVFEHGHFNIKDVHEWGYIITSEAIGMLFGRRNINCYVLSHLNANFGQISGKI